MSEILSKTFERVQTTPILNHGNSGSWDSLNVAEQSILDDGSQLIMYFLGQNAGGGTLAIGRATAPRTEPPVSWTKYAGNPILAADASGWEAGASGIRLGSVVKIGTTYYLYYCSTHRCEIGVATSTDGIHFVKYASNPILSPDGEYHCAIPYVINAGGVYYMYYTSSTVDNFWTPNQYRVASSNDGIHFTKIGVILNTSPGQWDSVYIEGCTVYQAADGYILVYTGYDGGTWANGVATSSSPVGPFTKFSGNPNFQRSGVVGTFDQSQVSTPLFFRMSERLYLFYQGAGYSGDYSSAYWNLGLAAIPLGPSTTGVLRVFASYNGTYVATSVMVTGPQNVEGTTTTDPSVPLSFSLTPGAYVVSGTYFVSKSENVLVVVGHTSNVTLNFGGSPPPPPPPPPELPLHLIFVVGAVALVASLVFFGRRRGAHHFSIKSGKRRREFRI
jgi:hypothetical protein